MSLDPVQIAQRREADDRLPYVYPQLFETRYREQPDGSQKEEDWVHIAKKGTTNPQVIPTRWRDIQRDQALMQVLQPFYDNWKKGQEAPVTGTPLSVWLADGGLVKVLKDVMVRTVEDFAEMPDHMLGKLNIGGLRAKQNEAKAFLAAKKDTSGVAAENAKLKDEVEMLKSNLAELRGLIEQHAIKKEQDAAPKRPRGRPRKLEVTPN